MLYRSRPIMPHNRSITRLLTLLGALLGTLSLAAGAQGVTLNVPAGYPTIQSAIDAAAAGDTVVVAAGNYGESLSWSNKDLTIQGAGAGLSIIDPGGNRRCLSTAGLTFASLIEGFTFRNGYSGPNYAGGMYNLGSSPTVINCCFYLNKGNWGGGMGNVNGSNPTVANCTFYGNWAFWFGAGMYNLDSSPTVTNCIFSGNKVVIGGGGGMVNVSSSNPAVTNCTFSGNIGARGGGIANANGSSPTITNSILWGNAASDSLTRTIYNESSATSVSNSDVQDGWVGIGSNNIDVDPNFVRNPYYGVDNQWATADDDYGDLHVQPGSPCINTGENTFLPSDMLDLDADGNFGEWIPFDLDNLGRMSGGTVDTGAYEFQENTAPVARDLNVQTNEDTPLDGRMAGRDPDHEPLQYRLVDLPLHGTIMSADDGTFTYTPSLDYNGPDSFTYIANDGAVDSNLGTVSITVNPVNDSPVAGNDAYTTNQDIPLVVASPGVLANDSDIDSSILTALLNTGPTNGTLTLNADGSFVYTPNAGFSGADSFTYHATDGQAQSHSAAVSITVKAAAKDYSTQIASIQTVKGQVQALVAGGVMLPADGQSLYAKLDAAIVALNTQDPVTAKLKLQDFINQVTSFIKTKKLTSAQGQPLIDAAKAVIAQI